MFKRKPDPFAPLPASFYEGITPENMAEKKAIMEQRRVEQVAWIALERAAIRRHDTALWMFLTVGLILNVLASLGQLDWIGRLFH